MKINLIHKDMTEKELYQEVKIIHKLYPDITMTPKEYLKRIRKISMKIHKTKETVKEFLDSCK